MRLLRDRRFLDPNPQPGTGGAPPAGAPPATPPATPPKRRPVVLPSRAEAGFQTLLIQYGGEENAVNLARYLYDENHSVRVKLKEAREGLDAFKTRNPEGSVVLHGQDLADYNAWKALGKPAEIKAQLEEATKTKTELATAKATAARTKAAELLGFNGAVLQDRLEIAKLDLEIQEETDAAGAKKPIAKVRKAGDANAQWESLAVVAERDWKDHLPALKVGGSSSSSASDPIIPFPNNGASGGSGAQSAVASFIKRNAEAAAQAPNPLLPQGARTGTK